MFLHINPDYVRDWRERPDVIVRAQELQRGEAHEAARYESLTQRRGVTYWALHSLSHALMAELALECGYPISSLKERVYASGVGST